MSKLEVRAKPIIERLLTEGSCTLNVNECKTLSIWATKTSMVLESVNPRDQWFYTNLERSGLYKEEIIPDFSAIWIAKLVDFPGVHSERKDLLKKIGEDEIPQRLAVVTTMSFASLAVQVQKVKRPKDSNEKVSISLEERKAPWAEIALQLWPLQSNLVHWPASIGLHGEHGIGTFALRFSPPYLPIE